MDNQIKRFLTRRNIFIIFGAIIAIELIWAVGTITKPKTQTVVTPPTQPTEVTKPQPTTITLTSNKKDVKIGEKVTVSINISSDKYTDGVDLIITYDPKLLAVETLKEKPIVLGALYTDYPANSLDSKGGRITVSGVSTKQGGVVPNGLFGSITFTARAAGLVEVSLDHTPSSTVDTNVIETGTSKDVLEKVEGLELNLLP